MLYPHSSVRLILLVLGAMALPATDHVYAQQALDFNRDVRPILSDKCIFCHGPDEEKRAADLRLDTEEGAKEWAVVPGDPDGSELISRISAADEDVRMPPPESGKSLTPEEQQVLRQWIAEGATWSQPWAYVRPAKAATPEVASAWPLNWIDHFVLDRMPAGISPSADADRVTLARRLYFDLLGLVPTPEEVEAFVADTRPDAVERLVDQLMASPHFGERLAIYWLDLVRYADTVGYHGDQVHSITPYRDWVIQAFNDNMPFDQFTREQLAGDLLEDPSIEQLIASGYNRLLQTSHEGGVQPKEYLAIYAADRVRNVSAVWMGATVGCAQCHDHKYDPYTTADFYRLSAFFADLDDAEHFKTGTNANPTLRSPEIDVLPVEYRARWEELQQQSALLAKELKEAGDNPPADLTERKKELDQALAPLNAVKRRTMISRALAEPRVTRVLPRGNWLDDSGPVVEPQVPGFLPAIETGGRRATRLDLANWLTDPDQGVGLLTARVMANRLCHVYWGRPLSPSLEDFGGQGSPPIAPELLDRLAVELVESGWDLKHLIRLLVTSHTYRQTSLVSETLLAQDPDNRWLARAQRFRLPAEVIRDNALRVSGLLVEDLGGPAAKPYQPAGYYRHLNFPPRKYQSDSGPQQYRRGVYVHWQRQFLHPTLKCLDAPSREECTAQRPRSNTPLAALALLNDPSFIEAARVFAARVVEAPAADDVERIAYAFRETLSRAPTETETESLQALLEAERAAYQEDPDAAAKLLNVGLAPAPAGDPGEVAAWTSVTRTLFNLNETLTRN